MNNATTYTIDFQSSPFHSTKRVLQWSWRQKHTFTIVWMSMNWGLPTIIGINDVQMTTPSQQVAITQSNFWASSEHRSILDLCAQYSGFVRAVFSISERAPAVFSFSESCAAQFSDFLKPDRCASRLDYCADYCADFSWALSIQCASLQRGGAQVGPQRGEKPNHCHADAYRLLRRPHCKADLRSGLKRAFVCCML